MGDFNPDLGNSIGDKAKHEPNQRGLKLLDFANYFNLCPVNLMGTCHGPTETYFSHCGRYRSTLDYIFLPNSLSEKNRFSKNIWYVKSIQSALSDLKRLPERLQSECNYRPFTI